MNNITDKEIRDAADKAYKDAGVNAYFANGFQMGAKWMQEQMQSQDKEPTMDIEIVVHSKEQERQAVEMFKSIGIKDALNFSSIDSFLETGSCYPFKLFVKHGNLTGEVLSDKEYKELPTRY